MALLFLCCGSYATMFFLLLLSSFVNQAFLSSIIEPIPVTFNNFSPDSCNNGTLLCMGTVTAGNGYLSLTPEPDAGNSTSPPSLPLNKVGRVLFHLPVLAWPATFTTTFTVRISTIPNTTGSGDGMAFIMAQDNKPSPPHSNGSYLGIMDKSTQGEYLSVFCVVVYRYVLHNQKRKA